MTDIITTPQRFKDRFGLSILEEDAVISVSPQERTALLNACTRMKKRVQGWDYTSYVQKNGGVAIRVVSTGDQERNKP